MEPNLKLEHCFKDYVELIEKGNALDVIEKYYGDNIKQYENNAEPIEGKAILKYNEQISLNGITSLKIEIINAIIDNEKQIVWGEMKIKFESKKSGKKKLTEAFYQRWVEGKIIEQKFYYKEPER